MEREDKERNRSYYNAHGQASDDRLRFENETHRRHAMELIVPWVTDYLREGDRVIDIAGGSGAHASRIVRAARVSVVGLDISEEMVRQRAEDPLLTENVVGDMEALPFEDGSFDAALFVAALHHVPDALPALREAARVLRPGGLLFVYEPNSLRAGRGGVAPIPEEPKEFRISVGWLEGRIRAAGFRVADIRTRRLTIRLANIVKWRTPMSVYHATDRIDRILMVVPGVDRLGGVAMIRAVKAA